MKVFASLFVGIFGNPRGPDVDDIYYPRRTLREYEAAGIDTSGFHQAETGEQPATFGFARGLTQSPKWVDEDGDGTIGPGYNFNLVIMIF